MKTILENVIVINEKKPTTMSKSINFVALVCHQNNLKENDLRNYGKNGKIQRIINNFKLN
jgi:hypothetical protein